MSRENVEIVRRMYDAFARGEYDTSLSYCDAEIEFSQPAGEPGGGTHHGREGVIQAFAQWLGAWDDYRVEVGELIDFGDDVLARTRHHGRGKGSGAAVEMRIFQLLTVRNGRIVRMRMYYDEAEALEAVGPRG
jgi:uncharacterized protein